MLIGILIAAIGATYTIDGIELARGEAAWLQQARVEYERDLLAFIQADTAATDATVESARADLEALPDGAEKTALTAQLVAIDTATAERVKLADRDFKKRARKRPTAIDARQNTLKVFYNNQQSKIRSGADIDKDGALQLGETGLPDFIFTAIDANSDGALSAAELDTYWTQLDGGK